MTIKTVGSVCSGIEAASVAWKPLGMEFAWLSEIEDFPSEILAERYPNVKNLGDMNCIPQLIADNEISAPDLICGGTPCQAFSLAGLKNGLNDERGNLSLRFIDIVEANDKRRGESGLDRTIVFWENVEGVLTDKTNAFGCFVCSLAGFDDIVEQRKWPCAGVMHGPVRNVAWRVLDAKYFGLPQQRRRLYVLAGGKDFFPENVLFEWRGADVRAKDFPSSNLTFEKDGHKFEIFREYTDCLYSSYGTKWNGNAAAYNGSLYVVQDERLRRLSPLECERLMGFPDDYTYLPGAKKTCRYKALGNSWAVPVIRWIGERLLEYDRLKFSDFIDLSGLCRYSFLLDPTIEIGGQGSFIDLEKYVPMHGESTLNCTSTPNECLFRELSAIVSPDAAEDIYISPVGCHGILRRKKERNMKINERLECVLKSISRQMPRDEIEKRSMVQKRGRTSIMYAMSHQNANFDL